jgi:hypothetical protein
MIGLSDGGARGNLARRQSLPLPMTIGDHEKWNVGDACLQVTTFCREETR